MNIAIIDDVDYDIKKLSEYLSMYFSDKCVNIPLHLSVYNSGIDFLENYERNSYDFIFIDYYMDHMTGMDLAKEIRKINTSVILIFVTASRDYAIDSYLVRASGYLVKPFDYNDLSSVLSLLNLREIKQKQFIELLNGEQKIKIILKDIVYCDIYGHYTQIHTKSMGLKRFRTPFWTLSDLFKPYPQFLLCYRGCIINMDHVVKMEDLNFYMTSGERIPFRKKENAQLLKAYSDFLFEKVREGEL